MIDPVAQALDLLDRDPAAEAIAPELRELLGDVYESVLCTENCRERERLADKYGGPPTDPDDRSHELLHHIGCGVWTLAEWVVVPMLTSRAAVIVVADQAEERGRRAQQVPELKLAGNAYVGMAERIRAAAGTIAVDVPGAAGR